MKVKAIKTNWSHVICCGYRVETEKLQGASQEELVDQLASLTTRYLKLMADGAELTEIDLHRSAIDAIIHQIRSRQQSYALSPANPGSLDNQQA